MLEVKKRNQKNLGCLYRYSDYSVSYTWPDDDVWLKPVHVKIEAHEYQIIKQTPMGVWILANFRKKFVLNHAVKKFAYPTKKLALSSFKARKSRQIEILTRQLNRAQQAFKLAENEEQNLISPLKG